ncbi:ATP-binding protein [Calothrix sp. PCC 6303]|uniref:GAF domain-containing hybrid sensor histidine kinase/response regulator n=1 Tax=Calothrix sp. PCC 6303 TaxID=1170562 RepID=UPI0002A059C5|nr:ATP-binding protein [Calothrix sp. PCC 6303]AFZ03470.1 GAF sensor signal transduction histidine kinase [Calothrix sp. PCC 6303]
MSIVVNSQLPDVTSHNLESIVTSADGSWLDAGAELVYIQSREGMYLSFNWQKCQCLDLDINQNLAKLNQEELFVPVDKVAYLQRLHRILATLVPERYQCWFRCRQQLMELELVISPVMTSLGHPATTVLVMGRLLQLNSNREDLKTPSSRLLATEPSVRIDKISPVTQETTLTLSRNNHQKLINRITRNIRRTLDLDDIWQQTVTDVGEGLGLERCIIFPYKPGDTDITVIAEYHQVGINSMLGLEINLASEIGFTQALETLKPFIIEHPVHPELHKQKILVAATCHQEQPNGLIVLTLCEERSSLTIDELESIKEVADQLGTAIAHATLYKELSAARQQAEEASRLKSEFLANVSHEIRTPLNGMMGFLKLILDGMVDDEEERNNFIEEAHRSSLHLLNIINDLLDFAKIEAGKMKLECSFVNLNELFTDVGSFISLQTEQRNLSFQLVQPETSDEIMVYGDYQRLKQVMLNLLSNAIKFTHEGGVTISADVVKKKNRFQDQEFPGMVRVRVADTGIGVSLDKQDKLFQSFSQVDGSRTRQYGGTGLGLVISQKLVEAMGGEVHFYSLGEGLGSTVTFTVPLYQQPVLIPGENIQE